jgi:hypothetical protein
MGIESSQVRLSKPNAHGSPEIVRVLLDGGMDHLSDEEIEKFVATFPIKTENSWRAASQVPGA